MGRQIGSALGVALLVAVLGAHASTVGDFHAAWRLTIVGGLAAAAVLAALGPAAAAPAGEPASGALVEAM